MVKILKATGKEIFEDPGVMPNPTVEKLNEGCKIAKDNNVDFILAVGGGSVCDYAKAVSVSTWCEGDPWEKFYLNGEEPKAGDRIIPIGSVLTMVGTGSEMNGGSVITNYSQKLKIGHVFGEEVYPKFTFSIPHRQMVAGFFDIMSHIMEQYFSGSDDNTSDYLAEGLMKSIIHSSRIAVKNPTDYEARSNIMWSSTWALNTLIGKAKSQDWMVHMLGQAIGAYTDATHGMTLSGVALPYYRLIFKDGLPKFVRFAKNVWGINPDGKSDEETALNGLEAMESWMKELGVTPDMFEGIAKSVFVLDSGYRKLSHEEIIGILKESM